MDQRPTEPSIELDTSVSLSRNTSPVTEHRVRLDPTPREVGQGEQQRVTAIAGPGQRLTVRGEHGPDLRRLIVVGGPRELLAGADVPQQPDACEVAARREPAVR